MRRPSTTFDLTVMLSQSPRQVVRVSVVGTVGCIGDDVAIEHFYNNVIILFI
jgi:hypothetical protein